MATPLREFSVPIMTEDYPVLLKESFREKQKETEKLASAAATESSA